VLVKVVLQMMAKILFVGFVVYQYSILQLHYYLEMSLLNYSVDLDDEEDLLHVHLEINEEILFSLNLVSYLLDVSFLEYTIEIAYPRYQYIHYQYRRLTTIEVHQLQMR
jgi:hypothetical protein